MAEVTIIGVDLPKNVFQLHGSAADGSVVFRKKLSRPQFARFMTDHSACEVALEACPGAHHWARVLSDQGHRVRLIAPHYVKPFLKRQKNDAADAEAISEAAMRPTMRFVEPKTEEQQARAVAFRGPSSTAGATCRMPPGAGPISRLPRSLVREPAGS